MFIFFFFQAEDGIRDKLVTGVQTCALPIWPPRRIGWGGRNRRCCLEQQGRFADSRIAADQDRRAGYEPAAANPIELGDAGQPTRRQHTRPSQADKPERAPTAAILGEPPLGESAGRTLARQFFDQAVPGAAAIAPTRPFGMDGPALLASVSSQGPGQR